MVRLSWRNDNGDIVVDEDGLPQIGSEGVIGKVSPWISSWVLILILRFTNSVSALRSIGNVVDRCIAVH